jgi:hypothetical protein
MSNPSTRRVAQKIRGNHGLPIGSAPQKVNEFNSCGSVNDSGERWMAGGGARRVEPVFRELVKSTAGEIPRCQPKPEQLNLIRKPHKLKARWGGP